MSVKFLHTADLHLGSPLDGLGAANRDLQQDLQAATYDAFRRLVTVAIQEAVEFVVVAGDLYDRESRSVRANQFAAEQFGRLDEANIPVYLVYGNHDPVESGIEFVDLPPNVHEFPADSPGSVIHETDGEERACLCGQSYRRKAESRAFHTEYDPVDSSLPTIGLVHTALDPGSDRYVPCDVSSLRDREAFDYWALGHIHEPRVEHRNPTIAYPGIPQGRHINEAGLRGAYLVDLSRDGQAELEFVPTGQIIWREEAVSIGTADTEMEPPDTIAGLRERIESQLFDLEPGLSEFDLNMPVRDGDWTPVGMMCRWILTGRGPAHDLLTADEDTLEIILSELRTRYDNRSPYVWTEAIRTRTGPPLPPLEDIQDDPIFDRFQETVEKIRSDPELRASLLDEEMGTVCVRDDGSEEERLTRLELTDDDMDRMIDRAAELVLDELRARRVE